MTYNPQDTAGDSLGMEYQTLDAFLREENHPSSNVYFSDELNPDGTVRVLVTIYDDSAFHLERAGKPAGEDDSILDHTTVEAIEQRLKEIEPELFATYGNATIFVEEEGNNVDYCPVHFCLAYNVDPGTTLEEISEYIDLFDATILNVTDPGTFGSQYIYDGLL